MSQAQVAPSHTAIALQSKREGDPLGNQEEVPKRKKGTLAVSKSGTKSSEGEKNIWPKCEHRLA